MRLIFLLIFFVFSFLSFSQGGKIIGTCVGKNGKFIENVKIAASSQTSNVTYSSERGFFELKIPANQNIEVLFRFDSLEIRELFVVQEGETKHIGKIVFPIQVQEIVIVQGDGNEKDKILKLPKLDLQKIPMGGVERTLIYTTAASSNNELTSNYNVRGGNYDENLVYVNGFLINRPFLTRSGQQEGLSFINSALVKDIRFSGGGFESKYGDKLSSVLDIDYKTPDSLNASLMASLLGVEAHVAHKVNSRLSYLFGARYRANGYLLNSLPTKGAYNPVFYDVQGLVDFSINEHLTWSTIVHASSNNYRFTPETQETNFGTVNESYRFKVYFEGQEQTKFETATIGTALKWAKNKTSLDFYGGVFRTNEQENFDVLGQYFINQLETNMGSENFGDSIDVVGIGSFLNHARNQLNATIINMYHNGSHRFDNKNKLFWGINYQQDRFEDVLSEWRYVDSAGYSLPQNNNQLEMYEVIKGKLQLNTQRISGFLQHTFEWSKAKNKLFVSVNKRTFDESGTKIKEKFSDTINVSYKKFLINTGFRSGYTEMNNEFYVTPRFSFTYFPRSYMYKDGQIMRRNTQIRFASGMYYQPPFYREFRTFDGQLNLNVKAQKSLHLVLGGDMNFNMWNRDVPFKVSTEAYYKYMWDINPYEVDNVRTRYYANNDARAYAYGLDVMLHGEFVEGIHSFFKVGFLSTKEDIINDEYTLYYNEAGERIFFGYSEDQKIVDSAVVNPGFIPRPTDQLMNFAILVQDKMPNHEALTAQLGLIFGTRLPYGPPDFERYKDTLRQKSYFRVDLGLSYDILHNKSKENSKFAKRFSDAIVSFEVFNLMGINNVLSMQWIQDVGGRYYAIPNYLTQRRFNLKLILRI
jgi:hypothetical protein